MLKIGLVTDAAAELPERALASPHLRVLPVKLVVDGETVMDTKNPTFTRQFNRTRLSVKTAGNAQSQAMTVAEIKQFYLESVATQFDHVFGIFVLSSRSPLYKNAADAASEVIAQSMPVRAAAGIRGPLLVEAYDSMNMADGLSVLVQDILQGIERGIGAAALRQRVAEVAPTVHCYVAPSQLDFIATRARARGDQSAGTLAIAAAKLLGVVPIILAKLGDTGPSVRVRGVEKAREHVLNLALRELRNGLKSKFISASFSGDLDIIESMPAWAKLVMACGAANVSLSLKPMSPTNSINVGPDAFSLGFAAAQHSADL